MPILKKMISMNWSGYNDFLKLINKIVDLHDIELQASSDFEYNLHYLDGRLYKKFKELCKKKNIKIVIAKKEERFIRR
jgi:hypothetical protein